MNVAVRRFCQSIPVLRVLYNASRRVYRRHGAMSAAKKYIVNLEDYRKALDTEDGTIVEIRTKDGLALLIRRNYMDAAILAEIFLEDCYVQGLTLPLHPVVVDIGGYIGDFALYAALRLSAQKVVVCEPSPSNWELLKKNIANNHFDDRIQSVNKAVTDGEDVMMNIDESDRGQARVSAYGSSDVAKHRISGITLAALVKDHELEVIDLLKMDCEGGEYTILSTTPTEVFSRIRNIVFEYHEIDGFQAKLEAAREKLVGEGFSVRNRGSLVYATRES